jgi:DHA1 family multidrug resistance protein-like MFS transporter
LSPRARRGKKKEDLAQEGPMNAFAAIVFASLLSRLGYQMARSPVLPAFAAHLGALPEFIGVIVAASTVTGVFFKLPSGALSDVLGRKRMMVLGALFFDPAVPLSLC